ncbi:uroporphyrinogen decarboxylase family protein [candidate division KSB1 bacterium]|nr:uroporphyrinogen decarboxylase family protein [candidate division KSB1 bacterium]
MQPTPRQQFLSYVRQPHSVRRVVSPFLPHPSVIQASLDYLGLPVTDDAIQNEIHLAQALDYEPMFMTDMPGLIFPWEVDARRSNAEVEISVMATPFGEWVREAPRKLVSWNEDVPCPVQTEADHFKLIWVCEQIETRATEIRTYFENWRRAVGENGVIVLGHPHPSWLGYQINPQTIFFHWQDYRATFQKSMQAIYEAALFVMQLALEAGIDFMSDSSYGLEMTSPDLFRTMDLPYIQAFARWTHDRHGLFWYHNCGQTRSLIRSGDFNRMEADVIETIAPPPEGDNDLAESRRHLDKNICSKGNFSLTLLREGAPAQIERAIREMVAAVQDYPHICSTADAVLPGTPPENFMTFVSTARQEC